MAATEVARGPTAAVATPAGRVLPIQRVAASDEGGESRPRRSRNRRRTRGAGAAAAGAAAGATGDEARAVGAGRGRVRRRGWLAPAAPSPPWRLGSWRCRSGRGCCGHERGRVTAAASGGIGRRRTQHVTRPGSGDTTRCPRPGLRAAARPRSASPRCGRSAVAGPAAPTLGADTAPRRPRHEAPRRHRRAAALLHRGAAPLLRRDGAAGGRRTRQPLPQGPRRHLRRARRAPVAYLDLTGSGSETVAHLRENGRITVMFCAFEGAPNIVRLHGTVVTSPSTTPSSPRTVGCSLTTPVPGASWWSTCRGSPTRAGMPSR